MVKLMAQNRQTLSSLVISVAIDRPTWYNTSERLTVRYYGCLFVI